VSRILGSAARHLRKRLLKARRSAADRGPPSDMEPEFWQLREACRDATMTSTERLYGLYKAVEYVVRAEIPGDFVECGVWRGGSVMMMALALQRFGGVGRRLHCFDTFEGMPPPDERDVRGDTGVAATEILSKADKLSARSVWAIASLDIVRANLASTGYPQELITCCPGKVEETLPAAAPAAIALLRLDTDWYASTKHELVHLYPRLSAGGVLIIDDYGFWRGARQATDEYFRESGGRILLNRVDNTGRIGVKID
jgi:O-methyltransferase